MSVRTRTNRIFCIVGALTLAGAFAVACASAGEVPAGSPQGVATSPDKMLPPGFHCELSPGMGLIGAAEDEQCRQPLADEANRSALTTQELLDAKRAAEEVKQELKRACGPDAGGEACFPVQLGSAAPTNRPGGVERIRQVLTDGGFTVVAVRLAQPTDPAPPGSIFYAVAAGTGCVLGSVDFAGVRLPRVVGTLPGGHCLA